MPVAVRSRHAHALGFASIALGACGPSRAPHLTFSAPDGPGSARGLPSSCSRAPDSRPAIDAAARDSPTARDRDRSRTTCSATDRSRRRRRSIDVDGFACSSQPSDAIDDSSFIPFVAALRWRGRARRHGDVSCDDAGAPRRSSSSATRSIDYALDGRARRPGRPTRWQSAPGQAMPSIAARRSDDVSRAASCGGRAAAASSACCSPTDGGDDATARALDLDCDRPRRRADDSGADCDDTRARFHAGAAETVRRRGHELRRRVHDAHRVRGDQRQRVRRCDDADGRRAVRRPHRHASARA